MRSRLEQGIASEAQDEKRETYSESEVMRIRLERGASSEVQEEGEVEVEVLDEEEVDVGAMQDAICSAR